jgi:uncharacterized protein (TIGR02246 family)
MAWRSLAVRVGFMGVVLAATACQSPPAPVRPDDPEIVAAVNAILDKVVAAASAADAEAVLSVTTMDDDFTFITGDTLLTGYSQALAAFRETYAMLKGQTYEGIARRTRVLAPDVVLVYSVSQGTYTDKAGFTSDPVGLGSTAIFVKRDGEWRVIHFHQSVAK